MEPLLLAAWAAQLDGPPHAGGAWPWWHLPSARLRLRKSCDDFERMRWPEGLGGRPMNGALARRAS